MAVHAERVRQRQRHRAAVIVCHVGGTSERRLRIVSIEQVALHVQHLTVGDDRLVEIVDAQRRRHPEVGVHRAFRIRGDHDDASPRRDLLGVATTDEPDADRSHVVAEDASEVVVVDLADVRRRSPEAGHADHRVRRAAAAHLDRTGERAVQLDGSVRLDQCHRPLDQFVLGEELLGGMSDHVDQRVPDADHVEAWACIVDAATVRPG